MQITAGQTIAQPSVQATSKVDFLKQVLINDLLLSVPGRAHLRSLGFKLKMENKRPIIYAKPANYNELSSDQLKVPHASTKDYDAFRDLHGITEIHLPNGVREPRAGQPAKQSEAV